MYFSESDYLTSKLAQLNAAGKTQFTTTAQVKAAIVAAGFTTQQHFEQFGSAEGTSPNAYFNANEYLAAKAAQVNAKNGVTTNTAASVKAAIEAAGMSVYNHFEQFGWAEGVNPSNSFDVSSYLATKAAQAGKTVAEVTAAFKANGFSPISHYMTHGVNETGVTVTAVPAAEQVTPSPVQVPGQTFTLTTGTDTFVGTAGNDTFTGVTGTVANPDSIIDQSATDNDTANLVVTAAYTPANISKVETVNIDWDAFGTATYNFTNVTGAKDINLTSAKVGFLGASTITAGANQHIVAGSGMTGLMTITGATTSTTVDATNSSGVSVTGTGTATVNAGANTTSVTTNGFASATVNAGTATTISVTDAAATTNTTSLTTNANSTITNATTGALTLNVGADKTVTMNAIGASLNVAGSGNVTINSTGLSGETVTNSKTSGTLTFVSSATTAHDLTNVKADNVKFTGTLNGAVTVASGAKIEVAAATTLVDVTVAGAGTADSATVTFTGTTPTATNLTLSGVETLNVVAAANAVAGNDLTITTLDLDTASNKAVISGANDISVGNITGTGQVDASAVTGTVALTQVAGGAALTLKGSATANNTVTFTATTAASNYTGGSANDTVVFANTAGSGVASATAVVGDGTNSVTANALTSGDLVVVAGSGNDTVSATAVTTASVNVQLGDGTNSLTIGTAAANALAGATIVYQGGAGNDTLTIADNITATDSITAKLGNGTNLVDIQGTATGANTINLTGGTGVDTLKVAAGTSLAASTLTLTDIDAIQIASAGTITFSGAQLSGKTYEIKGNANVLDVLAVTASTATGDTVDLSGLVMNQTIGSAVSAVSITTGNGNDTITGTSVADTVIAGNGTNVISTGAGNDTITGGTGNDTITGGSGSDTITVGAGNNVVVYTTSSDSTVTATATTITNDILNGFVTANDSLKVGIDVTAAQYSIATVVQAAGDSVAAINAALTTAADTLFTATVKAGFITAGGTASTAYATAAGGTVAGWFVFDADASGTWTAGDLAVTVIGTLTGTPTAADFIA